MRELEKVNLIRCKQCGMLYGEEIKHKCDNIRKAAYRQGKADAIDELYSHRYREEQDENDTMVYIWKSWFEQLKEQK